MKKFVAIFLALVLIFSMGVPSFAASQVELSPFQWSNLYSILQNIYDKNDTNVTINNLIYGIFNRLVTLDDNGNVDWGTYYDMGYMPLTQQFYGSWFWYVLQGMIDLRVDVLEELQNGTIPSKLTSMLEQNLSIMEYLSYVPDLFSNAWDSYSDSWFNQTYNQNNVLLGYVEYFPKLFTNEWDTFSDSWFNQTFTLSSLLYENSELFEDTYLEKNNFQYLNFNTAGLTYELKYNGTFADSVTKSLSFIGQSLTYKLMTSFENPFSSSGKTNVNSRYGALDNMIQHLNHQSGFLARLAYVLADDEEIRLNETLQDSKTEIVDFVGEGVTSSSGSSFSIMSGLTDGIEFSSSFLEFFDMGVSLDDVWLIFEDAEAFSWFTEETASNIDTVPVTYSRKPNPQTEIVTSYYEERQAEVFERWGALIG